MGREYLGKYNMNDMKNVMLYLSMDYDSYNCLLELLDEAVRKFA